MVEQETNGVPSSRNEETESIDPLASAIQRLDSLEVVVGIGRYQHELNALDESLTLQLPEDNRILAHCYFEIQSYQQAFSAYFKENGGGERFGAAYERRRNGDQIDEVEEEGLRLRNRSDRAAGAFNLTHRLIKANFYTRNLKPNMIQIAQLLAGPEAASLAESMIVEQEIEAFSQNGESPDQAAQQMVTEAKKLLTIAVDKDREAVLAQLELD